MPTRVPTSTYRLHLTGAFDLSDAADLVAHVDDLGADWLYLSPVQRVPAGASHGYHVLDPRVVDPQLGGEAALRALRDALRDRDRGMLLDIVPNHLAASPDNRRWADVLRLGADSPNAETFDIDFGAADNPQPIVLPVLDRSVEQAIADGTLRLDTSGDEPLLVVGDGLRLPLAPGTDPSAPLEDVLGAQHYRLHEWREGEQVLNWRRFFAINELVGVRVEDPAVFDDIHRLVLDLVAADTVQGLRVDHVDGLADPTEYLTRLREAVGPRPWVVVEKILELEEPLPEEWPVHGTTGYEMATLFGVWLIDSEGYQRLTDAFARRTGVSGPVVHELANSKHHVLTTLFTAEVDTIRERLGHVSGVVDREVASVLRDLIAHLDGYRTYAPVRGPIPRADHERLEAAAAAAAVTHGTHVVSAIMDRLMGDSGRSALIRLQQLSGAVTAKAFEDRLLYRHVALSSLCEVGVDAHALDHPPTPTRVAELLAARQRAWPTAGTTTSTHDTKRSEDVRARIAVLAEVPEPFLSLIDRLDGLLDPPAGGEHATWLLTQTALGMLDLEGDQPAGLTQRLRAYATKALRESGLRTSHDQPDEAFEAAVHRWVDQLTADGPAATALRGLADEIALPGASNALTQLTAKLVGPGVVDIYRGTEIWDGSLVDPDNRRPLRTDALMAASAGLDEALEEHDDRAEAVAALRAAWTDGRIKLHITREGLRLRREHPDLFLRGAVSSPAARGSAADHVVALRRDHDAHLPLLGVGTRLPHRLAGSEWPIGHVWGDTTVVLDGVSAVTDVLTGRVHTVHGGLLRMDGVLAVLPTAILVGHE